MKPNSAILGTCLLSSLFVQGVVIGAEVNFETSVQSIHVDRGLKESEWTWFPSVELSSDNFYIGAWSAQPFDGGGRTRFFLEEVDLYAGTGFALSEKWGMDLGATHSWTADDDDTTEAYLGIFGELGTISPSIYFFNDFDRDEQVVEGSATLAVPLEGFPFEFTGRLGFLEGDNDYSYFGMDLVYPMRLSDSSTLSLGMHYDENDYGFGAEEGLVYGSASWRFSF